jgi:hypothetical protein
MDVFVTEDFFVLATKIVSELTSFLQQRRVVADGRMVAAAAAIFRQGEHNHEKRNRAAQLVGLCGKARQARWKRGIIPSIA